MPVEGIHHLAGLGFGQAGLGFDFVPLVHYEGTVKMKG
jgi:hypothetical protein